MALNSLLCADVPLRNCLLTHSLTHPVNLIKYSITTKSIGKSTRNLTTITYVCRNYHYLYKQNIYIYIFITSYQLLCIPSNLKIFAAYFVFFIYFDLGSTSLSAFHCEQFMWLHWSDPAFICIISHLVTVNILALSLGFTSFLPLISCYRCYLFYDFTATISSWHWIAYYALMCH